MNFIYSTYSIRVVIVHYGQVLISLVKFKKNWQFKKDYTEKLKEREDFQSLIAFVVWPHRGIQRKENKESNHVSFKQTGRVEFGFVGLIYTYRLNQYMIS